MFQETRMNNVHTSRAKTKPKVPHLPISNKENESTSPRNDRKSVRESQKSVKLQASSIISTRKREKPRTSSQLSILLTPRVQDHRFQKKIFSRPTWCQFANKFIWGLNKSGYECRVCSMAVSRRFIAEAKKTSCGIERDGLLCVSTGQQMAQVTKAKVFTIYLPHGAKKSVLLNPKEPLRNVLEKVCRERGINMEEFVPEDENGEVVDLEKPLGEIPGGEITFTKSDHLGIGALSAPSAPTINNISSGEKKQIKVSDPSKKLAVKSQPSLEKLVTHSPLENSSVNTSPRRSVIDMYEFGPELGSGAFSVVKAATHRETQDIVAIKILDKYEDDDEQTQKFKQEIKIISSLHHENIVRFYELDEDDQNFYVVMELVGGGELFDFIIDNGALKEEEAVCIVAQVCKAIEYMHSVGTAHRDLKPENLLFKHTDHKVIKIADFGESKSFRDGTLTTYCGTPDYMAPEIIRGGTYGPEVDIWAIGVITYVILAGFPPFDGENDVEVFASILSVRYEYPSPEWDSISEEARNFIRAILIDDPQQRLTATQCLAHPWLVQRLPVEMRTNEKVEVGVVVPSPPTRDSLGNSEDSFRSSNDGKRKERKHRNEEELGLDLKQPKKQLLEMVDELFRTYPENYVLHGELKTISAVLEATSGKPFSVDLEKTIYQTYHKRLKEVQVVKRMKKKKK